MKEMRPTWEEMLAFVMKHRKGAAFKGFTPAQIYSTLRFAESLGGLAFVVAPDGSIAGVVTAIPDERRAMLRISHILCIKNNALPLLIAEFYERFPGFKLCAKRRGKEIVYNDTDKLCMRLCNLNTTYR